MNLIIDVGNTQTKLALFNEDTIVSVINVPTESLLLNLHTLFKEENILNTIISSVIKTKKEIITYLQKQSFLISLNTETKIPFNNLYKTPKTLGVDRIALMASVHKNFPKKNVLVIDAGTCITYDFLNANNEYFGGAIAPGLQMKYNAMHHFTAKLPLLKPKEEIPFGDSTKNAMHQGVINGTILEIDGVINQYQQKNTNLTIVLTGGDTNLLAKLLKSSIFANPNFLLEGLNHILNYNL